MRRAPAVRTGANALAGVAAESLDRPGDRDGGQHGRSGPEHRRRHRGDAGLALGDRLRPAAPADLGEGPGAERRAVDHVVAATPDRPTRTGPARRSRPSAAAGQPTGTVVRSPVRPFGRPRRIPARCRRGGRAGRSRRTRRAPRRAPDRPRPASGSGARRPVRRIAAPSTKRPSASRASSRCASSATASRWAVARGRPVASTSSASVRGPSATACENRRRDLSTTPIR